MLLVSPLVLVALGVLVARLSKAKRVWRKHGRFPWWAGVVIVVAYTLLSLAFLFDLERVAGWAAALGAPSGTAFFFGSGVVDWDVVWPAVPARWMAAAVVGSMLYPAWFLLGLEAGHWAFGRSPKQTGILGLLR